MFKKIRWRIAIPYLILILISMLLLTLHLSSWIRQAHLASLRGQMTKQALLLGEALASPLAGGSATASVDALAAHYADLLGVRVTVIRLDGTVVGESHENRLEMDDHLFRSEVQEALRTGQGSSVRYSPTVGYDMMYVATVVVGDDGPIGIARIAVALRQIEAAVARLRFAISVAALVATAVAAVLAVLIAERTAAPVRSLTQAVERMTAGDLKARVLPTTQDEVGTLMGRFNDMADRLRDTIMTLEYEQARLEAVLEHMADGVIIADGDGYVRLINHSAARLLQIADREALNRSFAEVVRDHRLIQLLQLCRAQQEEQTEAVELGRPKAFLRVLVTPLEVSDGASCLVVLQDLTEVHRLETVRRDFVSNISHELRTPLASLKALVETLRDGALDDPPAAERFLNRIETEVDALTQMVEELLELSRIESRQAPLRLQSVAVSEIVLPAVERLLAQAERAGLGVSVADLSHLPNVLADTERMRQVVTNLVHNAIKFTPAGGEISLKGELAGGEVVISVRDTGVGISVDALPRIFERFYKADRARSGGGTGLGLSIAKHVVQSHGGRIWAESREGQGSIFRFSLPLAN
jgi:two-component system phosphate regulon sensor histidine kinase PhoR